MVRDVELITESGVNVNLPDREHGRTPLHYAAKNGEWNT